MPASVWATGPIEPDQAWPPRLVARVVAEFSRPGDRVMLVPWPTTVGSDPASAGAGSGPADDAGERADTLAAVTGADRHGTIHQLPAPASGTASAPFWAPLLGDTGHPPTPATDGAPPAPGRQAADDPRRADLIITSVAPEHGDTRAADLVAATAARLLRVGGILAVITHSDWTSGRLTDPTGAIVAAGQNADLLYLQHVVALHSEIRDGRLDTPLPPAQAAERARLEHRAATRGLPAPHHRVHTDVLAFAQPSDHPLAPGGGHRIGAAR